jgi:hypothetical protein
MCVMASPVLACNIQAISAMQRPRYDDLVSRLRAAMRDCSELADGYSYSLDSAKITSPDVAEWIAMERLCCPFLTFQLKEEGEDSRLTMRGPDGVKVLLQQEVPAGSQAGGRDG